MKIRVDRETCQGYANCVIDAPDVFDLDEYGLVKLLVAEPPESLHGAVMEAVKDCPVRAIEIEE